MTDRGGKAAPTCPDCGGPLHVEQTFVDQQVIEGWQYAEDEIPRHSHLALVAFCAECEFCLEFTTAPSKEAAA